ncbi:uncharacterized protein ACO6RY_07576 [Pungitius sinensis]
MEVIYSNVEFEKLVDFTPRTNQTGPRSPRSRPHGAVAVSLGLLSVLLLAGLVCLGVHLQASGDKLSSVSAERDQLKDNLTALKDNFTALKDNFTALTQEKDRLQLLLKQKKTCPEGWRMFSGSCYLLSTRDDSWENGRKDCRDQGADLVIINSLKEQKFLLKITQIQSWIGLSDKDTEGTWKWVDGTLLTENYWYHNTNIVQPDNGGGDPQRGEEDCAHLLPPVNPQINWNDLSCDAALRWICEKPA